MNYQLHQQRSQTSSQRHHTNSSQHSIRSLYSSQKAYSISPDLPPIDHLTDFINGIYQGILSTTESIQGKPEGTGIVIDDDFNFIFCSSWKNGKLNGHTFIKLINQITIWGLWNNSIPVGVIAVQLKQYTIFLPYRHIELIPDKRLTRCMIINQKRQKAYTAVIDKKSHHENKSNREYNIVIEKIHTCKSNQNKVQSLCKNVFEYQFEEYMLNARYFLSFLYAQGYISSSVDLADYQQLNNFGRQNKKIMICINENAINVNAHKIPSAENQLKMNYNLYVQPLQRKKEVKCRRKLGLVLDWKKMTVNSLGVYAVSNSKKWDNIVNEFKLAGIGLSKTISEDAVIGVYKNDMIIKQITGHLHLGEQNSENLANGLRISQVVRDIKQKLAYQHMKSLAYIHDYLIFPELGKIAKIVIEINQYVSIFEKLAENRPQFQESSNDSKVEVGNIPETHLEYTKNNYNNDKKQNFNSLKYGIYEQPAHHQYQYQHEQITHQNNRRQDSSLVGQLQRQIQKKTILQYADHPSENYNNINTNRLQNLKLQQQLTAQKKPGFITKKSPVSIKHLDRSPSPVQLKLSDNYRRNGSISQPRPIKRNRKSNMNNNYVNGDRSQSKSNSKNKEQNNRCSPKRWRI